MHSFCNSSVTKNLNSENKNMAKNQIGNIRAGSTFAGYIPHTDEQKAALAAFKGLAEQLVAAASGFKPGVNPLSNASLFTMVSGPGTGKTHLMEAMLNYIRENSPELLKHIYLFRDNFTHATMTAVGDYSFDGKPIIFIDDLFSEHQSVNSLHPATEITGAMNFLSYAYENRCLVVITCNFPFVSGILPRIQERDKVGRIYSRCQEMFASAGEFHIKGPDYRTILAQKAAENKGPVPTLRFG